ncbi:hypothetical protein RG565_07075 [Streptococcus sp. IsoGale021]|uniref:hypothetical protein n=1 Tax=Streptococcus TaxID=1301 RepID=UPI002000BB25|nr:MULTISPECIES: hypothetical protein [Streptococcus]MCY7211090.1 hypothetical protein [Streptococcus anginosus]MCY7211831.1 hypothetical protein [Streptococcus anginosus]MCY7227179.1 hypothetical protein [Streptococcus anginosus]MDQ8695081.1 hypothetical protein [Streptococcus sp. IsoGale021]MEE0846809.1 hypothetical protein [Streptococcus anginosus]
MNTKLQKTLRDLRAKRLIHFGNPAYQRATNDWFFETVPTELTELWYGQDGLSFLTLSIAYDSDIDLMSENELIDRIDKERHINNRLEEIFSNLEKMKAGKSNGKD